ncbi:hypothetical protein J6590_020592, partial [Homalodisca vitripennis]
MLLSGRYFPLLHIVGTWKVRDRLAKQNPTVNITLFCTYGLNDYTIYDKAVACTNTRYQHSCVLFRLDHDTKVSSACQTSLPP